MRICLGICLIISSAYCGSPSTTTALDRRPELNSPAHVEGRRLAEHETSRHVRVVRVQPQPGQAVQESTDRDRGLGPRELRAEAEVRPQREGEVEPGVDAEDVEPVGVGKDSRIPVGAGDRYATRSPRWIRAPASSTSRVAYRSMTAAAGSKRIDSSMVLGKRSAPSRTSASASGSPSRCRTALTIMPSVVSIPPNISTAAFDTTSSWLSPCGARAASVSTDGLSVWPMARATAACSWPNASAPATVTGCPAVTSDTAATIAAYQDNTVAASTSRSPSASATNATASGPASSRRESAPPAGLVAD